MEKYKAPDYAVNMPDGVLAEIGARCASGPKRPAVSVLGRRYTRAALVERAGRLAGGLQGEGVGPGSRVALALPNIVDLPLLAMAVPMAGAEVTALDPRASAEDLARQLGETGASAVATANIGQLFDRVRAAADAAGEIPILVARMAEGLPFPRSMLLPLLRGAGLATVPADPRFPRLSDLEKAAPVGRRAAGDAELSEMAAEIERDLPSNGAVLYARMTTTRADVAAMLAVLARGLELVLAPRLDEKGLAALDMRHALSLALAEDVTAERLPQDLPRLLRA